jgi:hypothetical protein
MKLKQVSIPIYDFDVTFVEFEGAADAEYVEKLYKEFNIDDEDIETTQKQLKNEGKNGGDTFRNCEMRKILVAVFPCDDEVKRRNIVAHESRHAVDRILEWINVDDIEAAAYLQGYLAEFIY